MKRILVAGGAGFLGSNLCKRLIEDGEYVICLDNFYTGKEEHIKELINEKNFELIRADIIDKIDIKVNQIYNAACPASPKAYQKSPTNTMKTCVIGTMNLLELAKENNATFLQFSTSEVYGDPEVKIQSESYHGNVNPIGIRACYDEGKRAAESLCFDYNREFGTKIKVIRIFNTYGINMDKNDGRVVSNFIVQALNNEDITIYGNGSQTRSFCYVSDLMDAIIKTMNSREDFLGPVNLGNPCEYKIIDLAEEVIKLTASNSKIVYKELPQDDPTRRKPDIALAKKELQWEPTVELKDGLMKTIEYFKKVLQ